MLETFTSTRRSLVEGSRTVKISVLRSLVTRFPYTFVSDISKVFCPGRMPTCLGPPVHRVGSQVTTESSLGLAYKPTETSQSFTFRVLVV